MRRTVWYCREQDHFEGLAEILNLGWGLDPAINGGKPIALENGVVYHLIRYEPGEVRPVEAGEFDDVISVRDVAPNDADGWLAQGYKIQAVYQKNLILFKRQPKEEVA